MCEVGRYGNFRIPKSLITSRITPLEVRLINELFLLTIIGLSIEFDTAGVLSVVEIKYLKNYSYKKG